MDTNRAEARLRAERAATADRVVVLAADLAAVAAAASGSNLDDEHDPEGATVAFEREQAAAQRGQAQTRLADLDAALDRLHEGRYGRCEACGGLIADERLDTLPATRVCVACAGRDRR